MPANEEEIKALIDEKIQLLELINPLIIKSFEGKIHSLTCQKMELGEKDSSGRSKPVPIEGSEFDLTCDTIIPAVGQETDIDFVSSQLLKTKEGSYETQIPNVFIGGDALNGGVSAIAAIGDGRKAAQMIIDKSKIEFFTKKESVRQKTDYQNLMIKRTYRIKGIQTNKLSINNRNNFNLIETALTKEETIVEASRCLLCDELCNICTTVCPNLALFAFHTVPFEVVDKSGNQIFRLKQSTQILHIADWCNMCGNCNTFCPTSGAPNEEKPHLYLNKTAFNQADDAYYFIFTEDEQTLLYKNGTDIHSFAENPINYSYITKAFTAQIEKQTFKIQNVKYRIPDMQVDLAKAIEMNVILNGAKQFFGIDTFNK
jgi:putative selenate reductase